MLHSNSSKCRNQSMENKKKRKKKKKTFLRIGGKYGPRIITLINARWCDGVTIDIHAVLQKWRV